ncbi:hypothetical protein [Gorillibacterium massiliense]|uniref:hypothetical protein n=1 Tax=Gorillibacterium massiliense TaxID=1280390 RepID=UPI0005938F40|nr:hypothetical protein [Gorillibacterium massiliense]
MTYYGTVSLTKQKLYLLIASNIVLTAISIMFFLGNFSWSLLIVLLVLTSLLFIELHFSERKSSASISSTEFHFNRAYLFGFLAINRVYRFTHTHIIQECIDEIESTGAATFSSDTLDEATHATIVFYRNGAVFFE